MAKVVEGIAMIAGAIAIGFLLPGIGQVLGFAAFEGFADAAVGLGVMGLSFVMSGIADALQSTPGIQVAMRQPAMPWLIIYGRSRLSGALLAAREKARPE